MRKCRDCMGMDTYERKITEIPATVGVNTVLVAVEAEECVQCGAQLLDSDNANKLEAAYDRLRGGDVAGMEVVGTVYRLVQSA